MRLVFTILFLLTMTLSFAQKVRSTAYDLVLKTMLNDDIETITVPKAKEGLYKFIDARSLEEYKVSHIKDALWVGFDSFELHRMENIPKQTPLVIYCSIGYRSEKITEKLQNAGFEKVLNLYGGIFEWVNQDQQVFKDGKATKDVHAFSKTWGIWLNKGNKVY